uniref:Uncharacterized protein n=1 Tax=Arundo donax TaxID=35708 RepID=A0A0A9DV58_ARUDO
MWAAETALQQDRQRPPGGPLCFLPPAEGSNLTGATLNSVKVTESNFLFC